MKRPIVIVAMIYAAGLCAGPLLRVPPPAAIAAVALIAASQAVALALGRRASDPLLFAAVFTIGLCRHEGIARDDLAARLFPRVSVRDHLELERRLMAEAVGDLASFAGYLEQDWRAFYCALLGRYVVENLKVLLRLFGSEDWRQRAEELLIELPPGWELPVEDLMASPDLERFVERIPLRSLRQAARRALPLYGETHNRAFLEMALDRGYWAGVRAAAAGASPEEQEECVRPARAADKRVPRPFRITPSRVGPVPRYASGSTSLSRCEREIARTFFAKGNDALPA